MKRIAVLTGGGDAPGLNGILESLTRTLSRANYEVIGICDGFEGVYEKRYKVLTDEIGRGHHAEAGSFIGTSNKSSIRGREKEFVEKLEALNAEGLVVAGGDGTFNSLMNVASHIKIIGLPKTIDNDLSGTDFTFGYDTACSVVTNAVDALRKTSETHRRVMIVETMGRTSGWIALGSGLAGYADVILLPERPYDQKALLDFIREKKKTQRGLMIVASEGAMPKGGKPSVAFSVPGSVQGERFGGFSFELARWIEAETQWESRNVVLGHLQRSTSPTTLDRFLTMSMGIEAAHAVIDEDWNQAIVYRKGQVERAPIHDLMQPARLVSEDHRWVKMAQSLGIWL